MVAEAPRLQVPPSLLACREQPEPPTTSDDTVLSNWIVDLADAGDDCRGKLGEVAKIVAP